MPFEINERILEVRKSLKLSQTEFGKRIGVSRGVMNNIDLSIVEAKPLLIDQIVKTYNVNRVWLETGEGEMFVPQTDEQEISQIFGEALAEDGDPRRRKLLMSLINLVSNIPDEALPVVCEYAQQIADALKEDT